MGSGDAHLFTERQSLAGNVDDVVDDQLVNVSHGESS